MVTNIAFIGFDKQARREWENRYREVPDRPDYNLLFHADNVMDEAGVDALLAEKPDVVIIRNHPPAYAGLRLAQQLRQRGYTGAIELMTYRLAEQSRDGYGEENEVLPAAQQAGIITSWENENYMYAPYSMQRTANLAVMQEARKSRENDARHHDVAKIAVIANDKDVNTWVETLMRDYSTVSHSVQHHNQHFHTASGAADALKEFDVLVIQNDNVMHGIRLSEQLRRDGYEGKILLLVAESQHSERYERGLENAVGKTIDGYIGRDRCHQSPKMVAARIDELVRNCREALGKWDLELRLEQLAEEEGRWPEALRMSPAEQRRVGEAVKHAMPAQSVADCSYTALARELDKAWKNALKAALEDKVNRETQASRWDKDNDAPRPISEAERRQAAQERESYRKSRQSDLKKWSYRYYQEVFFRLLDWAKTHKEQEDRFPFAQQSRHGNLLSLSEALDLALAEAEKSGIAFGNYEAYRDTVNREFGRRVVDMLYAVDRLAGDIANREELENRVVMWLCRRGQIPIRNVPNEKETQLREVEKREIKQNNGAIQHPEMPKKWTQAAMRELDLKPGERNVR